MEPQPGPRWGWERLSSYCQDTTVHALHEASAAYESRTGTPLIALNDAISEILGMGIANTVLLDVQQALNTVFLDAQAADDLVDVAHKQFVLLLSNIAVTVPGTALGESVTAGLIALYHGVCTSVSESVRSRGLQLLTIFVHVLPGFGIPAEGFTVFPRLWQQIAQWLLNDSPRVRKEARFALQRLLQPLQFQVAEKQPEAPGRGRKGKKSQKSKAGSSDQPLAWNAFIICLETLSDFPKHLVEEIWPSAMRLLVEARPSGHAITEASPYSCVTESKADAEFQRTVETVPANRQAVEAIHPVLSCLTQPQYEWFQGGDDVQRYQPWLDGTVPLPWVEVMIFRGLKHDNWAVRKAVVERFIGHEPAILERLLESSGTSEVISKDLSTYPLLCCSIEFTFNVFLPYLSDPILYRGVDFGFSSNVATGLAVYCSLLPPTPLSHALHLLWTNLPSLRRTYAGTVAILIGLSHLHLPSPPAAEPHRIEDTYTVLEVL